VRPLIEPWPAGREFTRVFDRSYASTAFHPGARTEPCGRFHFFENARGRRVPVLYGAQDEAAAIAEAVLHDAPLGSGAVVPERRLVPLSIVRLVPGRPLHLAQLLGHGLRRLGVRAAQLTDTDPVAYPLTVAWAAALHRAFSTLDGLLWMSRQFNPQQALVLFGDRIAAEVDLVEVAPPVPLLVGPGRRAVDRAANQAGIAIL
jgi:hypothetical protein